jgi:RimJ/RimL family protein N-acetyltransferase
MTEKDTKKVREYITNPQVANFLTWEPYKNEVEIKKYFKYAFSCGDFPDEILCILFNNEVIGTAHLLKRDNENMQIGFGILPKFWNKGLGSKISLELIQYIKNSIWAKKINHIRAVIHKDNMYAQRIFTKLNFDLKQKNIKGDFDLYVLKL